MFSWAIALTSPNEEFVRKALEDERARRATSHRRVRERVGRFARAIYWLGFAAFVTIMLLGLYMGSTTALMLLADYQQGWLPAKYFIGAGVFLVVVPLIGGIFALRWLWLNRPSH